MTYGAWWLPRRWAERAWRCVSAPGERQITEALGAEFEHLQQAANLATGARGVMNGQPRRRYRRRPEGEDLCAATRAADAVVSRTELAIWPP
jgi:hypothetical protein